MAINRIEKLHHPGVLRDFAWPDGLVDFGRYNLIYGWNGTGKTTISRVFRDLELGRTPGAGDVLLNVDGRNINGEEFRSETQEVRVFNRDFIDDSVFQVTGGSIPLILVLGQQSVANQQRIDVLRESLAQADARVVEVTGKLNGAKHALDQYKTDQAKRIKELLRSTEGSSYDNYHRGTYELSAQKVTEQGGAAAHLLAEASLAKARALHTTSPKQPLQEISFHLPVLAAEASTVNDLLGRTVISQVIEALRDDAEVSDWVHKGWQLHEQRDAEVCLFCNQSLPAGRLSALQRHFNEGFALLQADLEAATSRLKSAMAAGSAVQLHDAARLHESLCR